MAVPGNKKEIDYLKAFSIILVVLYHVILLSDIYWYNMFYICLCIALQTVHVPLFILLAGFLCHKQNLRAFWQKKIRRILIPFLFMSCLKLLFTNLISPEFIHARSIPGQLFDAFLCGNLYWFSYCLLVLFLLAPLLWEHRIRIWVLLVLSLAADILIRKQQWVLPDVLQIAQVLQMLPFFLTGMLIARYPVSRILKKPGIRFGVLAAALIAGGICGYFRFHQDVNDSYYIDFIMGLCLMYLLYLAAVSLSSLCVKDGILTDIGKYSYQIMLFDSFYHWAIFRVLQNVLPNGIILILLVTALTLLFSLLTCRLLKRIPGISYLTGVKDII